jgi:hypothetical protein
MLITIHVHLEAIPYQYLILVHDSTPLRDASGLSAHPQIGHFKRLTETNLE